MPKYKSRNALVGKASLIYELAVDNYEVLYRRAGGAQPDQCGENYDAVREWRMGIDSNGTP